MGIDVSSQQLYHYINKFSSCKTSTSLRPKAYLVPPRTTTHCNALPRARTRRNADRMTTEYRTSNTLAHDRDCAVMAREIPSGIRDNNNTTAHGTCRRHTRQAVSLLYYMRTHCECIANALLTDESLRWDETADTNGLRYLKLLEGDIA